MVEYQAWFSMTSGHVFEWVMFFLNFQFAYQNDLINKTVLAAADGMYGACKGESIH